MPSIEELNTLAKTLTDIAVLIKQQTIGTVKPWWLPMASWNEKYNQLFTPTFIQSNKYSSDTITLRICHLAQNQLEISTRTVTATKFNVILRQEEHKRLYDDSLYHTYFHGTDKSSDLLSQSVNKFILCLHLQQQANLMQRIFALLYQRPLVIDDELLSRLSIEQQQILCTCHEFQQQIQFALKLSSQQPPTLTPLQIQQAYETLTLLKGNNPFAKLKESAKDIFDSLFDAKALTLLFKRFYIQSDYITQSLKKAHEQMIAGPLPEVRFPDQLHSATSQLSAYLQGCKTISISNGAATNHGFLVVEKAKSDDSILESLQSNFKYNTYKLLDPAKGSYFLLLFNYANQLIDKGSKLSTKEKLEGTSYKALGYRKGVATLAYLKFICENYESGQQNFSKALDVSWAQGYRFSSGTPGGKLSILEARPWLFAPKVCRTRKLTELAIAQHKVELQLR